MVHHIIYYREEEVVRVERLELIRKLKALDLAGAGAERPPPYDPTEIPAKAPPVMEQISYAECKESILMQRARQEEARLRLREEILRKKTQKTADLLEKTKRLQRVRQAGRYYVYLLCI